MPDNTDINTLQDSLHQEDSLPFFARYLEGQNNPEGSFRTTKYPSDLDEYTTQKYPSDDDEGYPDAY